MHRTLRCKGIAFFYNEYVNSNHVQGGMIKPLFGHSSSVPAIELYGLYVAFKTFLPTEGNDRFLMIKYDNNCTFYCDVCAFSSASSFLRTKLSNQTPWLLVGPLGLRWECISAHFYVNVKANIISSVCAEIGLFSGPIGRVSFHHWEKLAYFNSTLKAALIQLDSGCMFIQICSDSGFPLPYCLILVYFFVISVKGSERRSVRLW